MGALAGGQKFVAAENFVIDPDAQERFFANGGDDREGVVVERGTAIFGGDFEDGKAIASGLELTVGKPCSRRSWVRATSNHGR